MPTYPFLKTETPLVGERIEVLQGHAGSEEAGEADPLHQCPLKSTTTTQVFTTHVLFWVGFEHLNISPLESSERHHFHVRCPSIHNTTQMFKYSGLFIYNTLCGFHVMLPYFAINDGGALQRTLVSRLCLTYLSTFGGTLGKSDRPGNWTSLPGEAAK